VVVLIWLLLGFLAFIVMWMWAIFRQFGQRYHPAKGSLSVRHVASRYL